MTESGSAQPLGHSRCSGQFLSLALPPAMPAQICSSSPCKRAHPWLWWEPAAPNPPHPSWAPTLCLALLRFVLTRESRKPPCAAALGAALMSQAETFGSLRRLPEVMLKLLWIISWHGPNTSPSHGKVCGLWCRGHTGFSWESSCAGSAPALEGALPCPVPLVPAVAVPPSRGAPGAVLGCSLLAVAARGAVPAPLGSRAHGLGGSTVCSASSAPATSLTDGSCHGVRHTLQDPQCSRGIFPFSRTSRRCRVAARSSAGVQLWPSMGDSWCCCRAPGAV